jgi:hypothetical protein
MRACSTLTLVAVFLVGGVAAKLALFDPQPAKAVSTTSVDIQQMQQSITNLPVQKFQDMTFVFSGD